MALRTCVLAQCNWRRLFFFLHALFFYIKKREAGFRATLGAVDLMLRENDVREALPQVLLAQRVQATLSRVKMGKENMGMRLFVPGLCDAVCSTSSAVNSAQKKRVKLSLLKTRFFLIFRFLISWALPSRPALDCC